MTRYEPSFLRRTLRGISEENFDDRSSYVVRFSGSDLETEIRLQGKEDHYRGKEEHVKFASEISCRLGDDFFINRICDSKKGRYVFLSSKTKQESDKLESYFCSIFPSQKITVYERDLGIF